MANLVKAAVQHKVEKSSLNDFSVNELTGLAKQIEIDLLKKIERSTVKYFEKSF